MNAVPLTAVGSDGAIHSQLRVPLFLDEATDDVVAEDVELRGQVLGVGQGDLPVGEGATSATTGGVKKIRHTDIFFLADFIDEALGFVGLTPVRGAFVVFRTVSLPEVGQVHELLVSEADGGAVDLKGSRGSGSRHIVWFSLESLGVCWLVRGQASETQEGPPETDALVGLGLYDGDLIG